MAKALFVDIFAPKSVEKFVLPDRVKNELKHGVDSHFLFYGSSGLGKSSIAKVIASKYPHLYINASKQGKIDVLRGLVQEFCEEVQMNFDDTPSDIKVVIFDEIDGVSQAFFDALKGFMDTYQSNVRFIATTNYLNKIDPHVLSRFTKVNFNFVSSEEEEMMKKKYGAYIKMLINKALKKEIDDDALKFIIDKNFPDFRGALQTLQLLHKSGSDRFTLDQVKNSSYEFKELYELIIKGGKPEDIHKILMGEYSNKVPEVLSSLDNGLADYVLKTYPTLSRAVPIVAIEVCKYQSSMHQVIDPALAMKACVYSLMEIFQKAKQ